MYKLGSFTENNNYTSLLTTLSRGGVDGFFLKTMVINNLNFSQCFQDGIKIRQFSGILQYLRIADDALFVDQECGKIGRAHV